MKHFIGLTIGLAILVASCTAIDRSSQVLVYTQDDSINNRAQIESLGSVSGTNVSGL